ncbi:MAG: putative lipid II flippase FtsW, partial [Candidatus Omnitrophota bacterium]
LIPPFGKESGGANRWFRIGGFSFQPSEITKIILLIYMADFLSRKKHILHQFREGFLPALLVMALVVGLILLQPDFGTAMAIATVLLFMFFLAGVKIPQLGLTVACFIPVSVFYILLKPHAWRRIMAFLAPERDPQGIGFQIIQSFVALGSGGLFGVGLGQSKQKLFYLPASHTDFIFSIIGEELGLLGTLSVVVLFFLFTWSCYRILRKVQDGFGRLLGFGITAMITLEALVNIGVACGALPTKGLPLPFISYGGSALIANLIGVGFLLNISRYGIQHDSVFSSDFLEAGELYFVPKHFRFREKTRKR